MIFALTMGEPAGIGGEIAIKAWREKTRLAAPFFVIDDPERLAGLGYDVGIEVISEPEQAFECFPYALPVYPLGRRVEAMPGRLSSENAAAVIQAIDIAVEMALSGMVGGVVTNPINKAVLYGAGFKHPGHTEYIASLTGGKPIMLLTGAGLRVVPLTIHIPLREVFTQLSRDKIIETTVAVADSLVKDFGIPEPRLAIAGLNPHAGEDGKMGDEESLMIEPAITILQQIGLNVAGPLPPDTMFHSAARRSYDAALCMYHDQALIPLKTLAFDEGVNVTLGLSIVRTSPDHGTAFNIAGKDMASPNSLIAAINLAAEISRNRKKI